MERQKKAPRAGGARTNDAGSVKFKRHLEYITAPRQSQSPSRNRGLSTLLDQAVSRVEHYEDLARIYATEASKHRRILNSLQMLVPTGRRGPGGAA